LKTNIEHAKVYVDDPPPHKSAPMFRGPDAVNLNQGPHEIWVEAPGYEPINKSFEIKQGVTTTIDAPLTRLSYGYLVIDGNAGEIDVEINENEHAPYLSQREPLKIKLPAGAHKVVLDASGRKEFEGQVSVPRGQELAIHANLVESYPRAKAVVLGLFAVGAAVGGVFLHLEAEKPVGQPHDQEIHDVFNVTRFVAFGASGVLAGFSIFFFIYDPNPDSFLRSDEPREFREEKNEPAKPQKSAAMPTLSPIFGPNYGGVGVSGTF
jgi:hypothetical protein